MNPYAPIVLNGLKGYPMTLTVETIQLCIYGFAFLFFGLACIPMRRSFKILSFGLLTITLLAAPWVIR